MESGLLATKLRVPPQPRHSVHRERLVDALERGVPQHKITLISAPAGYGKSTLVAQWAGSTGLSVAWLGVDEEEGDVERFLRHLLASWEEARPQIRNSRPSLLLGATSPDVRAALTALISLADELADHTVFVLDDYHLVAAPAVHEALTYLLDHLPPTLHFVLAGRTVPSLPLARYRARGELLELRGEDMRFSIEETTDLIRRLTGSALEPDTVGALHSQTEGWAAGLQLAGLSIRRTPSATPTTMLGGRHRFIADYLRDDVLAPLDDRTQRFLLQTSILDRLSGPLCDAVAELEDSQGLLEDLEDQSLFIVPLDDAREWFRYHRLFADFLREELRRRHPAEVAPLHRRAARWHLSRDFPEPAFDHAVASGDAELVAQIAERFAPAKLMGGEYTVIQRWIASIPSAWLADYPQLALLQAMLHMLSGQPDACLRCLDEVEQRLSSVVWESARPHRAKLTAIRCFVACFQSDVARAEAFAREALRDLPADDLTFLPSVYSALGDTYRENGRWAEARENYVKVLAFSHSPTIRVESAHVFGALADLELRQGRLRQGAVYWRRALAAAEGREHWGHNPLSALGWAHIRLGEILYEWNDLAGTWECLSRGLARAELGDDVRPLIAGYLLACRAKLATGDPEAAAAHLGRARPLVEETPLPEWLSRFERLQLELWLASGQRRSAVAWAERALERDAPGGRPEREATQVTAARALVVGGDGPQVDRGLRLLKSLREAAEAEGREGALVEVLTLEALAHWRRGDRPSALSALERALRLAEPEGYVRLFADLGLTMVRLLQEARARAVLPDYVTSLLRAADAALEPEAAGRALPEPLSPRELEALRLIAAGLTNREIAETLVVSPETVKKHTSSIYGKLGVGNRTEAAARARELGLLD